MENTDAPARAPRPAPRGPSRPLVRYPVRPASVASDERLVRGLIADDPDAWRRFFARFDDLIRAVIHNSTRRGPVRLTSDDRADIRASFIESLCAHDHHKLRMFDRARGLCLKSWIALLAEHGAYDYLRAMRRWRTTGPQSPFVPGAEPTPENLLEAKQTAARLQHAVQTMSRREREVYELYFETDLDVREVAARMRTSVQTVYSRRHKIEVHLSRALRDEPCFPRRSAGAVSEGL